MAETKRASFTSAGSLAGLPSMHSSGDSPRRIRRLDPSVVQRIAAGEVVLRPASALKELLENSIDARSTVVSVTIHGGGFKVLSVSDNGCGIHPDDLPILCRRFTTSKLRSLADLRCMYTFGFRGEALASLSVVGNVEVSSRVADLPHGYLGKYDKGELVATSSSRSCHGSSSTSSSQHFAEPLAPNKSATTSTSPTSAVSASSSFLHHPGLQVSARDRGTTFRITQLFASFPERKKMLGTPHEEYSKCLDLCRKYALDNPHIRLVCKRQDKTEAELSTPGYLVSPPSASCSSSSSPSAYSSSSTEHEKPSTETHETTKKKISVREHRPEKEDCEEREEEGAEDTGDSQQAQQGKVRERSLPSTSSLCGETVESPYTRSELEKMKQASRQDGLAMLVIKKTYGSVIAKGLMEIDYRLVLPRAAWRFAPSSHREDAHEKFGERTSDSLPDETGGPTACRYEKEEEEKKNKGDSDEGEKKGRSEGGERVGEEGKEPDKRDEGDTEMIRTSDELDATEEERRLSRWDGDSDGDKGEVTKQEKKKNKKILERQEEQGHGDANRTEDTENRKRQCEVNVWGYASRSSAGQKPPGAFILFINSRLVECPSLKKCIEAVYKDILPRGLKPWIYLSITLPPWLLDVNVHPTKQQVQLLYEDYIAGSLSGHFQKLLEEQAGSQTLDVRPISSISHLSQKTIQGQSFPFSASSGPCQDSSDVAQTQSPAESAAGVSSTRSSEEQDTLQESSSSAFHSPCVFETIHLSGGGEQGPAIIRTFSEDESTDAVSEVSSQIGTDGCTALQRAGKPSSSAPSFPASRSKSACGSGSSHSTSGTGTESRTALKPTRVRTDYRQTTLSSFLMTSHRSDPPPLSHRHHTQRPVVEEEQKSQTVSSSVGEMDTAPSVSSSSSSSTSSSPTVHSCRSGLINTGTQGRHDPVPSSQGNTDSTRLVSPSSTSCSTPAGLPSDSSASLLASSSSTTASRGSFLSFKSKTVEKIMNTRPPLEQIVIRRFSTDAPYLTSVQSLLSLVVSNSHDASHDPTSSYLSSADISSLPNSHFSCAHMAGNATSYPFSSSTSHNQVRQETRGSLLLSGSQKQLHGRSATQGTSAWMRQGVFVGCLNGSYALLQYDRYLLLVQLRKVLKECLYQSVLRRLGRLPPVGFSKPLDLKRLLMTGIKKCLLSSRRRYQRWLKSVSHLSTSEDQASDDLEKNKKKATFALEKRRGSRQSLECLNKEIILDACLDCLVKHRHLLCDYFSIAIVQMASVRRGQESTEQKRSPRAHSKRLRGEEEKEVRTVGTDRKDRGEKEEEERGREKKSRDADHYTKIEKTSQDPEEDKNGAVQRRGNAESIQSRKRKSCQHEDQEEEKDVEEQRDAFETSGCRDWVISTLPLCMGSYICIEKLPRLIIDLVARVDWEDEKNCLKDISLLLASFFTSLPSEEEGLRTARQAKGDEESKVAERVGDGCSSSQNSPNSNEATCARPEINRIHERYFLPALRTYWKGLLPKRFYEDGTIQVIASLPALYRVFERC